MAALWNRAGRYIFAMWFLFLSSFFFSSPNLSRCRLDVCHTSTHDVALVQIYDAGLKQVSFLGSVTAQHSSSGHQPNFVALNRGHHLYLSGRPSRWALAHILIIITRWGIIKIINFKQIVCYWYLCEIGKPSAELTLREIVCKTYGAGNVCTASFVKRSHWWCCYLFPNLHNEINNIGLMWNFACFG